MDFIVNQYLRIVDALGEELEMLEERILTEPFSRDSTTQIYKLKRDLISMKRIVAPVIEMSGRPKRFEDEMLIPAPTRLYFRDVFDHTLRINEMIDSVQDLLGTALEAHLSMLSVSQNEDTGWPRICGDFCRGDGYCRHLRHELRVHAGAPLAAGIPFAMALIVGLCVTLYVQIQASQVAVAVAALADNTGAALRSATGS